MIINANIQKFDSLAKSEEFRALFFSFLFSFSFETPEASDTLILPPNEKTKSDLNSFSDPYHSNFRGSKPSEVVFKYLLK